MPISESVRGGAVKLNSGYLIPLLGLGTYKIKSSLVKQAVDAALTCGYRLFDTAKYYANEKELGEAFQELLPKHNLPRDDIFIVTKFHMNADDPAGGARKSVMESLELLKTSYLDMVLIHYPKAMTLDDKDPRNKTHRKLAYLELEKMKGEGKIRSVGVSNYEIKHIEEIKSFSKMIPAENQVEIQPHCTRNDLREYCKKEGIFVQAFASLGRLAPDLVSEPAIIKLSEKYHTSVPVILLAFGICQGIGVIPMSFEEKLIKQNSESTAMVQNYETSRHKRLSHQQHLTKASEEESSPSSPRSHFHYTTFEIRWKVVGQRHVQAADIHLTADEIHVLQGLNRDKHYIECAGWCVA